MDNQKRLTHYVTNTNFNQQIESLQMDIKNIIEKIATASDDLKTMKTYSEIFNSKLKSKIEMPDVKKEVDMIWNQFSKFCSYEHIQKIERKIDPFIEIVSNKVSEFEKDNINNKEIIRRFDEILLDKASKFNITEIKSVIEGLLSKHSFEEHK